MLMMYITMAPNTLMVIIAAVRLMPCRLIRPSL